MIKKVLLLSVSIGLLVFLGVSAVRVHKKKADLTSQIEVLEKEIQTLQEKEQTLKAQISESETESYWEKRLREQGYKKGGEEVAVVLPPEAPAEEQAGEGPSFWQRFWQKLKFWRD